MRSLKRKRKGTSKKSAVALTYQELDQLPKISASGTGQIAEQILELAKKNNIPIQEDRALTELLKQLPVGSPISPEAFRLVAEIVVFLYNADKEWREKHPFVAGAL